MGPGQLHCLHWLSQGGMEDNQCKMLLNKLPELRIFALPIELHKFVDALEDLNKVWISCFSGKLLPSYQKDIARFRESYLLLNISVTPKIHAIFQHVAEFCETHATSLGKYSEQASESVHSDFKKMWERYKIPTHHPLFGEYLLKAVVNYNSLHV